MRSTQKVELITELLQHVQYGGDIFGRKKTFFDILSDKEEDFVLTGLDRLDNALKGLIILRDQMLLKASNSLN